MQRRCLSAAALRALRIRFAVDRFPVDRFPVDKAIQGGKNDNVGTRQDEVLSFDERTGSRTLAVRVRLVRISITHHPESTIIHRAQHSPHAKFDESERWWCSVKID